MSGLFNTTLPTVLVVDDSATSRFAIDRQLKKLGCGVTSASDGASALGVLATYRFDLVLLDCQMPDLDGYEVARQFRLRERKSNTPYTPIIAISAEADAEHMQLCLDSGMDGVLGKPLPAEELKKMLALWCDFDVQAVPPLSIAEVRAVDLPALFRSTSRDDINALHDAVTRSDLIAVRGLAHRMKGAALTMDAHAIVETLVRLEMMAAETTPVEPEALSAEVRELGKQLLAYR